ncbi:hypothetical protein [Stenotrophomonas sp.]|uniref:hypothetical protein n=1 Tax=Stenotrophomonas sp. TaxID=69392 RepID=UPI00289E7480|nr:hypothetical protein [Stenotrophomonas sp.]
MLPELQIAFQTIKHGTEIVKGLAAADKAFDQAEIKLKLNDVTGLLLDARAAVTDANDQLIERDAEIGRLREALRNKDEVTKQHDAYYTKDGEGQPMGAPYCMKCFEVDHRLVHLISSARADIKVVCPQCKNQFERRFASTIRPAGVEG